MNLFLFNLDGKKAFEKFFKTSLPFKKKKISKKRN